MNRRALLAAIGASGIGLHAGCVGEPAEPRGEADVADYDPGDKPPTGVWPQIGYDARHTRYVPHASGPRREPEIAWRAIGDRPVYPPVVDDGLYVAEAWTDGAVLGLDSQSGDIEWTNADPAPMRWTTALIEDTVLAIDRTDGNINRLYGIDPVSGDTQWTQETGIEASSTTRPPSGATISDGDYFIGSNRGVIAGDGATGQPEWEATLTDHTIEGERGTWRTDWAKPCVTENYVFTFDVNKRREETREIYALDRSTGEEVWTAALEFDDDWALQHNLVAGAEHVFVSTLYAPTVSLAYDGPWKGEQRLMALAEDTGDVAWDIGIDGSIREPFAYARGTVYVGSWHPDDETGQLVAIDALEGDVEWTHESDAGSVGPPVIGEQSIFVPVDEAIVAIDRTNRDVEWRLDLDVRPEMLVLVADRLYALTNVNHNHDSEVIAIE